MRDAASLAGRSALITGSVGGLGLAMARKLASAGVSVVLTGLEPAAAEAARAELTIAFGVDAHYVQADLTQADEVRRLVERASAFGPLDILVNNAVVRHFAPVCEFPLAEWDKALAVNLTAALIATQMVLPSMRARDYGRIFNMTSVCGMRGTVNRIDYVTTKTAIQRFTRAIALETAGSAVSCHALTPGSVLTPVWQARIDETMRREGLSRAEAEAAGIVLISLPTPQVVHDVALSLVPARPRIVIDLSTTGPRMSATVAARLGEAGITFADAPVSGGRGGALAGKLSLMVACGPVAWDEIEPLLRVFGKAFRVGDAAGQAQTMKLVNNTLSVVALAATCEGMAMGVKAGLDPQVMLDVPNASSGRNSATTDKFPRAVLPRTFDFGFATQLSIKDMRLCLDEAEAMGVPMMMGTTARTMLNITQARFGGSSDFTEMARVVEQWADVEIDGRRSA